ncbi:entry exclusion lipoprotein TrbK [Citrobacter freundii]|uniref:entry exclusion lipoprotein TrbK n=1 Tax=Citrobacter freundii TaxID=546 RepID=UPI0019082D91|nr:entry exclusion lipoprotein TrbK [Citrobacter freundii]MBJ9038586.1 entry exclusion lipoprotein TrbK [Citrobacter freundii]
MSPPISRVEAEVMALKGLVVGVLMGAVLVGCGDDAIADKQYDVSDETCKADYWKTLPAGKSRDDLVAQCLRRGEYKHSEPKTW